MKKLFLVLVALLFSSQAWAVCSVTSLAGQSITVSANPFDAIWTLDQCHLFVSATVNSNVVIDVFVNNGSGTISKMHTMTLQGGTAGKMGIGPNGNTLWVAGYSWIGKVDIASLIANSWTISPSYWTDDAGAAGVVYLLRAQNSSVVIASEEYNSSVVFLASGALTLTTRLAVEPNPVGLSLSADESTLYVTSQRRASGSIVCSAEGSFPIGAVSKIAVSGPSVTATADAGCSPVRVTNDGTYLYVTVRGDDTVKVFAMSNMALSATVSTSYDPVGIVYNGYMNVVNSARFSGSPSLFQYTTGSGTLYYQQSVSTGDVPREVVVSPDGNLIAVINTGQNNQVYTVDFH